MVIDIAGIIYMILALYIIGAILITGLLALGIWGLLKIRRRAPRQHITAKEEKHLPDNRPSPKVIQPHAHAL